MNRAFFRVFCLTAIFCFGFISTATAVEKKKGWSFSLDLMRLGVRGNDVHVGDVFHYTEKGETNGGTDSVKYGMSYEPIITKMESGFTPRFEAVYAADKGSFAVSAWFFNTNGVAGGYVDTPRWEMDGNSYVFFLNGVRMFDQSLVPTTDMREPSGFSPVVYSAGNKLSNFSFELMVTRKLSEGKNLSVDATLGLKLGGLNNVRSEGQKLEAFVFNYFGQNKHLWNRIALRSKSGADTGLLVGPSLGVQGTVVVNTTIITGSLNQAFLFGGADISGNWKDIDDIWIVRGSPWFGIYEPVSQAFYWEGNFPVNEKVRVSIPVTELRMSASRDINKNIALGTGAFVSVWQNVPLAPKWSVPGNWTSIQGTGWKLQNGTLSYYGWNLSLTYKF